MRLRHSARGLVVDDQFRLLLYRFIAPGGGLTVWCPPGGGLEGDETPSEALARELDEEIGLRDYGAATHVWHEEIRDPAILPGWGGAINDYFLVPVATAFEPCGSLGREALAAELVEHFEWWSVDRLLSHSVEKCSGHAIYPTGLHAWSRMGHRVRRIDLFGRREGCEVAIENEHFGIETRLRWGYGALRA